MWQKCLYCEILEWPTSSMLLVKGLGIRDGDWGIEREVVELSLNVLVVSRGLFGLPPRGSSPVSLSPRGCHSCPSGF